MHLFTSYRAPRASRRASRGRLGSLALLVALGLGCDESAQGPKGLSFDVRDDGPYAVGYRELEVTYTPPDGGADRTIPVIMWYPVEPEVAEALTAPIRPLYLYVESERAYTDAPAAEPDYPGGFPVVVHSHGHLGWANQSYHLGEQLAAHGFVFVAPGHVGNQIYDQNGYVEQVDNHYERVFDIRNTLDLLENLPASDPMAGDFNTERVVLTGHSRGTVTVWAMLTGGFDSSYVQMRCTAGDFDAGGGCPSAKLAVYDQDMSDPRIVGGVPMAGDGGPSWQGGFAAMDAVTLPVLMMTGSEDPVGADTLWAQVTSPPMIWTEYQGGCHDLFGLGTCSAAQIDNAVAQPAIRAYLLAFARRQIFGDDDATVLGILDGTTPVSAIVDFQAR